MHRKKLKTSRYVAAFAITFVIFLLGFLVSNMVNEHKLEQVYDLENDIFYSRPARSYDHSEILGDIVIDFDSKGSMSGIEIFNASKYFGRSKLFVRNIIHHAVSIIISEKYIQI